MKPSGEPEIDSSTEESLQKLEAFVLDEKLRELERSLGKFNLFTTLRLHDREIIHSRMLAWLLSPDESHDLGDLFLRRWLMRVLHNFRGGSANRPSVIQVEVAKWREVEVFTEWKPRGSKDRLDVLVNLYTEEGQSWQIAIEMKVRSVQAKGQLAKYEQALKKDYPDRDHRILLFLTRDGELADEQTDFVSVDFHHLKEALEEILAERAERLGSGPRGLIENYLNLIKNWFMDDSDIAEQAQRIYSKHSEALELLFQHRPDAVAKVTKILAERLPGVLTNPGVEAYRSVRGHCYFIPKCWKVAANDEGRWVYFDLETYFEKARLCIRLDSEPASWENLIRISSQKPFSRQGKPKPTGASATLHSVDLKVSVPRDDESNIVDLANDILARVEKLWAKTDMQQILQQTAAAIQKDGSGYVRK